MVGSPVPRADRDYFYFSFLFATISTDQSYAAGGFFFFVYSDSRHTSKQEFHTHGCCWFGSRCSGTKREQAVNFQRKFQMHGSFASVASRHENPGTWTSECLASEGGGSKNQLLGFHGIADRASTPLRASRKITLSARRTPLKPRAEFYRACLCRTE